ncbi:MAG: hypothetical protein PF505_06740, partial [Vallitaleaceae bacterium]|nr:hypothetical protein [Vallitaleaceae bacterium]
NRVSTDYVGLFSEINSALIKNIYLENTDITGHNKVGTVAGFNTDSDLIDCFTSGSIIGNDYVGGLIGKITESSGVLVVNACSSSGTVSGHDYVGGLLGSTDYSTLISFSNSSADVQGNIYVGGFAGSVYGVSGSGSPNIVMCHSTGNVTGANNIGGLVGKVKFYSSEFLGGGSLSISDSSASGTINQVDIDNTSSSYNVGGLIGLATGAIYLETSVFIGNIITQNNNVCVGGITGYNQVQIFNDDVYPGDTTYCYSTGNIVVNGSNVTVGGLIGLNNGSISYSYATGEISSSTEIGSNTYGGLVGKTTSTIKYSIAFNKSITYISGTSNRIVGVNTGGSLINNYAYGWMNGVAITDGTNTLNGENGSNIYDDSFSDLAFYNNSIFWDTNPWNANSSIYYTLKDARLVLYYENTLENQISNDDGSLFDSRPSPVAPTISNYVMSPYDISLRKLLITLAAPATGNTNAYKINSDGSTFNIPEIDDVMTEFTEITDYTSLQLDIGNGENIGIVEVDSSNQAKRFVQFEAVVEYSMNGSGTDADPYQIAKIEDLYALYGSRRTSTFLSYDQVYSLSASYILINDLDFANPANYYDPENNMSVIAGYVYNGSNISTTKTGMGFTPIGIDGDHCFSGTFNGGGHTVNNLYINRPLTASNDYMGFFGYIVRAEISNLNLTNAHVQGYKNCGILVGMAHDTAYMYYSTIDNCNVQGSVKGYESIGGLVGSCPYGIIRNCTANITVEATRVTYSYAGGITGLSGSEYVGICDGARIDSCTVTGTVTGSGKVAAITPWGKTEYITNCNSSGCTVITF